MPEPIFSGQYFSICLDEDGVEYVACGDEVLVVPVTADGQVIVSRERAPAFGDTTLTLAGGAVEAGEDHAATANRELQEEIGLRAGRLDALGELRRLAKYLTIRTFVFLARDLTESHLPGDEYYEIPLRQVPLRDVERLVAAGELQDAASVAAMLLARGFIEHETSTGSAE